MSKAEDMLLISQVVISDDRLAFDKLVRKYQSPVRDFTKSYWAIMLADDLAQKLLSSISEYPFF